MAVLNPRELKDAASRRISETSFDPRNLMLIFTGVTVALSLSVSGLNLYLNEQIGTTGGLGGLGLRSVLQTAQTILSYFATFFTPFWAAGLLYAMVSLFRGQKVGPGALLQGFRRFGTILSYTLWELMIYGLVCMVLCYVITYLYLMTPLARDFIRFMEELMQSGNLFLADGTINMSLLPVDTLYVMLMPMLVIYAIVAVSLVFYLSYHFRMGTFLLVEGIHRGAFGALVVSSRLMKGHKWQMLKLDLSFWWYYLLEGLLLGVLYLDVILAAVGVSLPLNAVTAFVLTIALHGVLQLGLHWWKKAEIDVTYAAAYDAIYQEALPSDHGDPAPRQL